MTGAPVSPDADPGSHRNPDSGPDADPGPGPDVRLDPDVRPGPVSQPVRDPRTLLRHDALVGVVALGACAALLLTGGVAAAVIPSTTEGSVGFLQRASVAADSGDELSFIAPQGWFDVSETVDESVVPVSVRYESPDGTSTIVVGGGDDEADPGERVDSVAEHRVCRDSPRTGLEACADVRLIAWAGPFAPGTDTAAGTGTNVGTAAVDGPAAARAVADSIGVVS